MRYGKKLAISLESDKLKGVDRPVVSHKLLKEILTRIVKALKDGESDAHLTEIVEEFSDVMDTDLSSITQFVGTEERSIDPLIDRLLDQGRLLGIFGSRVLLDHISAIERVFASACPALQSAIGEDLKSIWVSLTMQVADLADRFNSIMNRIQSNMAYVDLNVAGFRKLLKQYHKQVPERNRTNVLTVTEYRRIIVGFIDLTARLEFARIPLEEAMQALSPGVPPLLVVHVGSETRLAHACPNAIKAGASEATALTSSTVTPSPSIPRVFDFADLMNGSGLDLAQLNTKLFTL
jgi:hypothetical protein